LIKGLLNKIESDFEHKLIHSKVLKWIVVTGLSSTIFITGMIVYNAWTIELCKPIFSGTCLSNFSYNMKFPATLITATLALSGFWALIFRSHQTSSLIEASQKQTQLTINNNTFNNYIAHNKVFNDILEGIEHQHQCKVLHKSFIYDSIFSSNSPTYMSFTSDGTYLTKINKEYEELLDKLSPYITEILKVDPRIDPDIGLEIGNIDDFIFINTHMKHLSICIESLQIKGTDFQKVSYPDKDEIQESHTTVSVPMDLETSLWVVGILIRQLSKFSNTSYKTIVPSPDLIKAIDIYTLSARLISND
jgi:hypothetical protein